MTLGQRIRSLRESKGLSKTDLSKRTDCLDMNIHRWEHDRHQPNIYHTKKLAEVFNMTVDELLEGVEL